METQIQPTSVQSDQKTMKNRQPDRLQVSKVGERSPLSNISTDNSYFGSAQNPKELPSDGASEMPLKSESSATTFQGNLAKFVPLKSVPLFQMKPHQCEQTNYAWANEYQDPPAMKQPQTRAPNMLSSAKKAAVFVYRENDEPVRELKPQKLSTFAERQTPDKGEHESASSDASNFGQGPPNLNCPFRVQTKFDAAIFDERLELRSSESDHDSSPALSCDDPVTNFSDQRILEAPVSANGVGRRGGLKLNNASVLNISAAIRKHITQQQKPSDLLPPQSDTESESDISSQSSMRNVGAARIAMAAARANASQFVRCPKLVPMAKDSKTEFNSDKSLNSSSSSQPGSMQPAGTSKRLMFRQKLMMSQNTIRMEELQKKKEKQLNSRLIKSTCISIKSKSSKGSCLGRSIRKVKKQELNQNPPNLANQRELLNLRIAKGISFDGENQTTDQVSTPPALRPLKMHSMVVNCEQQDGLDQNYTDSSPPNCQEMRPPKSGVPGIAKAAGKLDFFRLNSNANIQATCDETPTGDSALLKMSEGVSEISSALPYDNQIPTESDSSPACMLPPRSPDFCVKSASKQSPLRSPMGRKGLSAQQALKRSIKKVQRRNGSDVSSSASPSASPSPSPDSAYELEEDLRTFEEKYKVLDDGDILGQGCSSVVKLCVLRSAEQKKEASEAVSPVRRTYKKHESSPLLSHIMQKVNAVTIPQPKEGLKLRVTPCEQSESASKAFNLMIKTINEEEEEGFTSRRMNTPDSVSEEELKQPMKAEEEVQSPECKFLGPEASVSPFDESLEPVISKKAPERRHTIMQTGNTPLAVKEGDQPLECIDTSEKSTEKEDIKDEQKENFAVKIIRTQEEELIEVAYEEYKLLRDIRHEGIVRMRDAFYNSMKSTIFLVMDLVPGRAMRQMFEDPEQPVDMTTSEIKVAFRQLLEIIDFLQDEEVAICHRDINPNNIMIELRPTEHGAREVKLKLIDFNVAKRFIDTETGNPLLLMTNTGTPMYQAPEMLAGAMASYDEAVDLWAAGCVLYYMLTGGVHAFDQQNNEEIEAAILKGAFHGHLDCYKQIDEEAKNLINGLLKVESAERYTIQQALSHPWLMQ